MRTKRARSVSVSSELPIKGLMACGAEWVVARMEKRPLADYGIPPGGWLGIRFWEGLLWGFAMLSAIVLFLRATGHFQIDSVALNGPALLRYALGWGAVFMAVAINEEFAFRGYWLFIMARRLRLLAGGTFSFGDIRRGAPAQSGRERLRHSASGGDRVAVLFDDTEDRDLVVCGGISRGLGLGGDLFLWHAG